MKLLLSHDRIDVNLIGADGLTAVENAIKADKITSVKTLVEHGANIIHLKKVSYNLAAALVSSLIGFRC